MMRSVRKTAGVLVTLALLVSLLGTGTANLNSAHAGPHDDIDPVPVRVDLPDVTQVTLENGLTLVVMERHAAPLVNMSLLVPVGVVHTPPQQPLLAEMTTSLLQGGTRHLNAQELANSFERLGASMSTSTDAEQSALRVTAVSHEYQRVLPLLANMVVNPAFPESELALQKELALASLEGMRDDPALLADAHADALLYGPAHPLGRYPTQEGVERLSVDDIRAFYERYWRPQGAMLFVIGDMQTDDVVAMVREHFELWESTASAPPPESESRSRPGPSAALTGPRIRFVEKPGLSQVTIHLVQSGVTWSDGRRNPSEMFTAALGNAGFRSRLMRTVRDRDGLTYGVRATQSHTSFDGTISISTFTGTQTLGPMMATLRDEVTGFVTEGVTPDELAMVKALWIGSYPMGFGSLSALTEKVSQAMFRKERIEEIEGRAFAYERVTLQEVNRALEEVLFPDSWVIVLVGDPAALDDGPGELWGVPVEEIERVRWTDRIEG